MTTLDDDAWEDLLSFIEERRVIPIVGPELLSAELRPLRDVRLWRERIQKARQGVG